MQRVSDYFLLFHGVKEPSELQGLTFNPPSHKEHFIELASLVLITHRRNFQQFILLDYFAELCQILTPTPIKDKESLYLLQVYLIEYIDENFNHDELLLLHQAFVFLQEHQLISPETLQQLSTLFEAHNIHTTPHPLSTDSQQENNFLEKKEHFIQSLLALQALNPKERFIKELQEIQSYIQNQKFSIGITGVMNAGKSTLLNALMGAEILGSSVIPETANLSIVKYSPKPYAKVSYWNHLEWKSLQDQAQDNLAIKKFISETLSSFKDNIDTFITHEGFHEEIEIKDLALYTSAEHSQHKCNLVKYVTLGVDVPFLCDGIEIVDTPGLDDPVIQREEITKEYMRDCDLMMHLMNVSQSATLKDIEFIIDALLYQNVTALLIIITRADTVNETQLQEVISYTRSSIKKELKALNQESKIDFILNALHFISVSGYMALQHRIGKEDLALKEGFDLEKTGILELEQYLNETLFGPNSQKNILLLKGIGQRITTAIEHELSQLNYELELLNKSDEELAIELQNFQVRQNQAKETIERLSHDISSQKQELSEYVKSLDSFIATALEKLQNLIKSRLITETSYALQEEKKTLQSTQVSVIISRTLKDGILDIVRDYRYKCMQKMETIRTHVQHKFAKSKLELESHQELSNISDFFKDDFESRFLSSNFEQMYRDINTIISQAKLKHIHKTEQTLHESLQKHIKPLEKNIITQAQKLTQILLDQFFIALHKPLYTLEKLSTEQEESIHNSIHQSKTQDLHKEKQALQTHSTIKKLQQHLGDIS